MSNNIAVSVKNVKKDFYLPHETSNSMKSKIVGLFKGKKKGGDVHHALRGVSFEIEKGDFFGIVGRNGSGKSTLLKIISNIYVPDSGEVKVHGKLTPFIELGVGFNPELSGRENVFLNGALLGFSRDEVKSIYNDIVEFAELERFMDQKLKNYSSGMQVRLAFSIAIQADTDILVLDEVLAVGDSAFQQKCFDYFAKLKREKKTVILVTHSMAQVERFCNKAVLLEGGKIIERGSVSDVTVRYENLFIDDINRAVENDTALSKGRLKGKFDIELLLYQNGKQVTGLQALKPFDIYAKIQSEIDLQKLNVGFNIRDAFGNVVYSTDIRLLNNQKEISIKKSVPKEVKLTIDNFFTNGEYLIDIIMVDEAQEGNQKLLLNQNNLATFQVKGITSHPHGMFHPNTKLEVYDEK